MRFIDIFVQGLLASGIVKEDDLPSGWSPDPDAWVREKLREALVHFDIGVLAALALSVKATEIGACSQAFLSLPFDRCHGLNRLIDEAVGACIWQLEETLGRHQKVT